MSIFFRVCLFGSCIINMSLCKSCRVTTLRKVSFETQFTPSLHFLNKRVSFIMYSGSLGYLSILQIWSMCRYFNRKRFPASVVSSFLLFQYMDLPNKHTRQRFWQWAWESVCMGYLFDFFLS